MEQAVARHKGNVVVVLDFGSQYTHLITRRVRQLGVCSVCLPGTVTLPTITSYAPSLVILSGGPHSVHEPGSPSLPPSFFEYTAANHITVLGICYGLQLIVKVLGGHVKPADSQEYGRMDVLPLSGSMLFGDGPLCTRLSVWMSHGDEAVKLPDGFSVVCKSVQGGIAAIENPSLGIYGLQFHPEVTHTVHGTEVLKQILFNVSGITADWKLQDVLQEQLELINSAVGPTQHAICALSGGVDSTVAATMVHRAIGDRLHCVFVDNGLLRYKERERVMSTFEKDLHLPVTCVDASENFLGKLKGVTDPEEKRKIIGREFINAFDEFSIAMEKKHGIKPSFLVQGTLYPDVIESCPPPGTGKGHSHTIKSHHNVGGLPKEMQLKLVEPLRWLFKDEVRKLGELLNVPEGFLKRHPFPGPGLAVRILGDVTQAGALETIRQVLSLFYCEFLDI